MMAVLNFYHIGKKIPEGAIYIGRRNINFGLEQSKFANPFPLKDKDDRERVINLYRQWLWTEIKEGRIGKDELRELKDKDLVCYCHPKTCHGDILMKAIEWSCNVDKIKEEGKIPEINRKQTLKP